MRLARLPLPGNARADPDDAHPKPLGWGFQALAQGRYEEAIGLIEPVRDTAHRFGGSHAQRDPLTLTLIEAAIRAGQLHLARH